MRVACENEREDQGEASAELALTRAKRVESCMWLREGKVREQGREEGRGRSGESLCC